MAVFIIAIIAVLLAVLIAGLIINLGSPARLSWLGHHGLHWRAPLAHLHNLLKS